MSPGSGADSALSEILAKHLVGRQLDNLCAHWMALASATDARPRDSGGSADRHI
jgi:hypothetical protein